MASIMSAQRRLRANAIINLGLPFRARYVAPGRHSVAKLGEQAWRETRALVISLRADRSGWRAIRDHTTVADYWVTT